MRVTFALFSYNHERYVRLALKAALAQDFSSLEILVTDDCSTDGTFEIIESILASYKGEHTIIVNRNAENLGVARHINRAMELASGDIIVAAAADDISMPNRVSEVVRKFETSEQPLYSVCSAVCVIDDRGIALGRRQISARADVLDILTGDKRWITGCSHAWHRRLFEEFGPLKSEVIAEDKVLGFRAMLLGGAIGYIDKDLVLYRQHDSSISSASFVYRHSHMLLASALSHMADFQTYTRSYEKIPFRNELREQIDVLLKRAKAHVRIAEGSFPAALVAWLSNIAVVDHRAAAIMIGAKLGRRWRNRRLPTGQPVS